MDLSVIPTVQDGRGDTPGPGCTTDMGRPWAAAQLLAGEGIIAVDVRSTEDWQAGHLPGALSMPAERAEDLLHLLPPPELDHNIVVYDSGGGEPSDQVASLLRARGWTSARRLVGGFAEWTEEGEEIER